ncbi:MAG: hypothetical protein BWX79_02049 [Alphaproteobacteria bacterium ADurb.Bin100]|nr:MAG: hypothetical protein BWX79_02049 [Alphaproteobacteria bacterium ADurb.Bin100]
MPQVLAPRLELLGGLADRLAEPHQGVPEAVRVEVRQPGAGECIPEDRADARGTAPVRPFQPEGLKLPRRPQPYARRREQRIVIAPQHLLPQKRNPVRHDLADVIADREEVGGEGLAELRLDLPCILIHAARDEVDVLQLHRCNRAVPRAGQQREGDQGTIAPLDLALPRHHGDDVPGLLQRRANLFPPGRRHPHILLRQVEIVGV